MSSFPARSNAILKPRSSHAGLFFLHGCGVGFPAQKFADPITAFPLRLVAVARQPPASRQQADCVGRWAVTAADPVVFAYRSFHVYHLCLGSAKFANSEAKTEFQLHGYERTALLRDVARGFPAIAWAGVDVPANSWSTGHLRKDGHGMARRAWTATPSTGKTSAKVAHVSIK